MSDIKQSRAASASKALDRIEANPNTGGKVGRRGYRRIILKRPPYSIIYREETDSIDIVAFAHHKRKPDYWRKRLRS